MRTIRLTLAYDGGAYEGWQFQPDRPTLQGTLERVAAQVTGAEVSVLSAGRTDTGVHALGQVASFRTESQLPVEVLKRALNAELPNDMVVLDAAEAPAEFHPTHHARWKHYCYVLYDGLQRNVLYRRYAWHFRHGRLDDGAMRQAAAPLLGTHDFRSFATAGSPRKTTVRTLMRLDVTRVAGFPFVCGPLETRPPRELPCDPPPAPPGEPSGDWLRFDVAANGFLYNMVRALVGTLVQVGRGAQPVGWPAQVLQANLRRKAGPTAPPHGLFMVQVAY